MKKSSKKKVQKAVKKALGRASNAPKSSAPIKKSAIGVTPLGDRVLVRPMTPEEAGTTTNFGLIIPDTVDKEKSDRGVVAAVGAGKKTESGERIAPEVGEGDRVLYKKPWTDPVKVNGVEYYLISEDEILAILD